MYWFNPWVIKHRHATTNLHKCMSKMGNWRMIMSGKPIEFPQTRVFRPAVQRISLGGLIGLTFLSPAYTCFSLWGLCCVRMAYLWLFSGWWNLLCRDFVLIIFRRDVHKVFFIVFLLRLSRISKLIYIESQNWRVFYLLPVCRKKKKSQSILSILHHDNKLSFLYIGPHYLWGNGEICL